MIATILGATLRILYAFHGGIWRDEAQALAIARLPGVGQLLDFLVHHESHPPFYYFLLRGWLAVFGDSDASGLAPSLFLGVLLIPLVFVVVRAVASPRAGAVSAILIAVHPGLIQYSASIRPYSFLSLLTVGLIFVLWRILHNGANAGRLIAYASLSVLLVYTHHWAWLVLAATGVIWLAIAAWRGRWKELRGLVLVHVVIAALYAPWLPSLLHQIRVAGHVPQGATPGQALRKAVWAITWLQPIVAAVLLGLSAWVRYSFQRDNPALNQRLALGLFAGVPGFCAAVTAALVPYVELTAPWCYSMAAAAYLIAVALLIGQEAEGKHRFRALALQGAWVAVMIVTWARVGSIPRSDTREVAERIRSRMTASDRLVVAPSYLVPAFHRYFGDSGNARSLPEGTLSALIPYDNRVARDLDPAAWVRMLEFLNSARDSCSRLWMVIEAYPPSHLRPLVAALLEEADRRLGPTHLTAWSPSTIGGLEHSLVYEFDPCRRSAAEAMIRQIARASG